MDRRHFFKSLKGFHQHPIAETQAPGLTIRQEWCVVRSGCLCSNCMDSCDKQALAFNDQGFILPTDQCDACGSCIPVCPTQAISLGQDLQPEQEASIPITTLESLLE